MKLHEYIFIGILTAFIFTTVAVCWGYLPDIHQIQMERKKLNTYIEMNKRYKPLE